MSSALLHALKYDDTPEVGELLGRWYGESIKKSQNEKKGRSLIALSYQYQVLHPKRLKKRGYNQSSCFAQGLSDIMQIPVQEKVLVRVKATESQTRKGKLERWNNVKHVFAIENKDLIFQKRILLVDDVLTTGSTLEACLDIL